ncbi:MAG: hypothetical protein GY903_28865 [Fuerstiella sp.]|nr:hypothetical protein [Fuerstiella sp.]MCP4858507.1 hypothetical protein [Fuerstiella sp.]
MDASFILSVISRWAHVGTAIVLVGGTAFYRLAVIPSLEGDCRDLVERIRNRWKMVVHLGILIFLVSGFYNYFTMIPMHKGDILYHALLGTKMMLAMFVFFIASVLAGNRPGTQMFRDDAKRWTGVMLMVAVVIVGISGFVKVRPIPAAAAVVQPSE